MLVGIGAGTVMMVRFNVSIAVICMVDSDPRPADALVTSLEAGGGNGTGGAATRGNGELEEMGEKGQVRPCYWLRYSVAILWK